MVFDLGGVIATDPSPLACRELAKITGIEFNKVYKIVRKNQDPVQRRKISVKKYWENVKKDLKSDFDVSEIEKIFLKSLRPYPRVINLVKKLKEKYKVGLLSNTEKENFEYWKKKYSFDKLFDVIITSFETGSRKPEKKIYKILIEKLDVKPEEIVFVDNEIKNLRGASKLGIKTVHYNSYENFLKELNKLLWLHGI